MNVHSLSFRAFKAVMALPFQVTVVIPLILLYCSGWQPDNMVLWTSFLGIAVFFGRLAIGSFYYQAFFEVRQWHPCTMGSNEQDGYHGALRLCAQSHDIGCCPDTHRRSIDARLLGHWPLGGGIPHHQHVLFCVVRRARLTEAFRSGI